MKFVGSCMLLFAPVACTSLVAPAFAAGDLLVAPTRLVLSESSGGEVLLSNKGAESAIYRASVVLKRMQADGLFEEVTQPSPEQQELIDMINYAPRRVVLAPGQTQTIRVAARIPPAWPSGEYRAHMLFRAVPSDMQATQSAQDGVSIALTPIYGVTIPVVIRKGALDAQLAITNIRLTRTTNKAAIAFELDRTGNRSVYGTVRVFKPGTAGAIAEMRGVAVYNEINHRTVSIPLSDADAAKARGTVTVRFLEEGSSDSKVSAEGSATL